MVINCVLSFQAESSVVHKNHLLYIWWEMHIMQKLGVLHILLYNFYIHLAIYSREQAVGILILMQLYWCTNKQNLYETLYFQMYILLRNYWEPILIKNGWLHWFSQRQPATKNVLIGCRKCMGYIKRTVCWEIKGYAITGGIIELSIQVRSPFNLFDSFCDLKILIRTRLPTSIGHTCDLINGKPYTHLAQSCKI